MIGSQILEWGQQFYFEPLRHPYTDTHTKPRLPPQKEKPLLWLWSCSQAERGSLVWQISLKNFSTKMSKTYTYLQKQSQRLHYPCFSLILETQRNLGSSDLKKNGLSHVHLIILWWIFNGISWTSHLSERYMVITVPTDTDSAWFTEAASQELIIYWIKKCML